MVANVTQEVRRANHIKLGEVRPGSKKIIFKIKFELKLVISSGIEVSNEEFTTTLSSNLIMIKFGPK